MYSCQQVVIAVNVTISKLCAEMPTVVIPPSTWAARR